MALVNEIQKANEVFSIPFTLEVHKDQIFVMFEFVYVPPEIVFARRGTENSMLNIS